MFVVITQNLLCFVEFPRTVARFIGVPKSFLFSIPIINDEKMLLLIYRGDQMNCHNKLKINCSFKFAKWAPSLNFYEHTHIFNLSLK